MTKYIIIAGLLMLSLTCLIVGNPSAANKVLDGFNISEVRFDESMGNKRPTPIIPKGWRFVGVSNGEKRNSNNLWFQDQSGNIYLVQGFTTGSEFILLEPIGKINAGK